jgi:NAD(P)-dependent dehydrogenase (short-subunit alcohol dehydrogenase family)
MRFQHKTIVITGASDGIGKALALALAQENAYLVLAARRLPELQAVADACIALGAQAIAVPCDVAVRADCTALMAKAQAQFGGIDVLVNNAGVSMHGWFEDITDTAVYEKLFQINVMGAIDCTHAALPALKASKGLIVGVSSLAGKTGVPARTTYCMSKFAMNGFFEALRIELVDDGVAVCMVQPGVVATDIRRNGWNAKGERAGSAGLSEEKAMPLDTCTALIMNAMRSRQRELIMGAQGKLGLWLKPFFPGFIDTMARRALSKVGQRKPQR